MVEQTNSETSDQQKPSHDDLVEALYNLGTNLKEALRTVWESQERKKVQTDIEAGLRDLGTTLNEAATEFKESSVGQQIKSDVDDLQDRLRKSEIDVKIRTELVDILHTVNAELEDLIRVKKSSESSTQEGASDQSEQS